MEIQSAQQHGYQAGSSDNSSDRDRCFNLDLELPHPDNYLPETVDFPSSPSAMMRKRLAENREYGKSNNEFGLDTEEDRSFHTVIDHNSVHLRKDDDWCDSTNVSDTEEYFEDFHLPMTHVNSMSTRRSFRRKVQSVHLHEPDADRIEGIVKSGQLNRHGSIRRKIVPQPYDFINDFVNDSFNDVEHKLESIGLEIAPLDEETLLKIKDCLDGEKMKDIYTLGSRLQDLLSPTEMKEIIKNSHRYSDVITQDILLVLSESRQQNDTINQSVKSKNDFANQLQLNQPPDLIDTNENRFVGSHGQQQKVKKRISIMDDIIRTPDESDTEGDTAPHTLSRQVEEITRVETSSKSESLLPTPSDGWDISPDGINSHDGLENSIAERMPKPDLIPEISAQEEKDEERNWRSVVISGLERKIDLKVIEPYKKVLSHGGYQNNDCQTAVIVFSACFLPDRSRVDYDYVMEHLFLYVLTTLDQLVAEDYNLIYFHGATPKNCIPRFSWVKNCYQMIDRRLRKNLKRLYLVHPTLWLKAAVLMCRPFISAKFSRKIMYVPNLTSLSTLLPMDHVCIPDRVKQYDLLKESLSNG